MNRVLFVNFDWVNCELVKNNHSITNSQFTQSQLTQSQIKKYAKNQSRSSRNRLYWASTH